MDLEGPNGRHHDAADLIGGEDHDFVVNLYLALLGRWPDDGGYRRYRDLVAGRPERRLDAVREVAASEEAHRAGTRIAFGSGPAIPPGPNRVLALSLALRTEWLRHEVARLRESLGEVAGSALGPEVLEVRDAALHFEINALRREITERIEAGLGPLPEGAAAAREAAIGSVTAMLEAHVAGLVAAAEAKFEVRLRALERRVIAIEAQRGA
ncbi:DUF4214 domain-containing protein [Roseicella aquatilis]|nr:DUF4214 domain-containing protein [Roseicella aquatilis]